MRRIAVACFFLAACSAVDDFGTFRFVADGGASNAADLATALPSSVGDACSVASGCGGGLTCITTVGNASFPGGICSHTCDLQLPNCPGASDCAQVENAVVCVPRCDTTVGPSCRSGYACCHGGKIAVGAGDCAPSTSNFCGG